jgi:ATP synthase protein I
MDDRDNQAFEQRLAAAQAAEDAKVKREPRSADAGSTERAISLAMRLGVELVAAMVIAVGLGWVVDHFAHTAPWAMIIMVPVGMAAGLRNLLRAGGRSTR